MKAFLKRRLTQLEARVTPPTSESKSWQIMIVDKVGNQTLREVITWDPHLKTCTSQVAEGAK